MLGGLSARRIFVTPRRWMIQQTLRPWQFPCAGMAGIWILYFDIILGATISVAICIVALTIVYIARTCVAGAIVFLTENILAISAFHDAQC